MTIIRGEVEVIARALCRLNKKNPDERYSNPRNANAVLWHLYKAEAESIHQALDRNRAAKRAANRGVKSCPTTNHLMA